MTLVIKGRTYKMPIYSTDHVVEPIRTVTILFIFLYIPIHKMGASPTRKILNIEAWVYFHSC